MSEFLFYRDNDNVITFRNVSAILLSTGEEAPVGPAATVLVWVRSLDNVDVDGQTWPLQMLAIGTSSDYIGMLLHTLEVPEDEYKLIRTVNAGPNQYGTWTSRVLVRDRS